jgi:ferredoxin-thioredoxin reductase catalytic subunit/rubredoxin
MNQIQVTDNEVDKLYEKLKKEGEQSGYYLNHDVEFARDLIRSLIINEKRYKYWACPCRLAEGVKEKDLDIICPCDYRDPDLSQYGTCFCALYISAENYKNKKQLSSIPERRDSHTKTGQDKNGKAAQLIQLNSESGSMLSLAYPVYRCKVCGYLCAREHPPELCPICKVKKDRFERFI